MISQAEFLAHGLERYGRAFLRALQALDEGEFRGDVRREVQEVRMRDYVRTGRWVGTIALVVVSLGMLAYGDRVGGFWTMLLALIVKP